MNPKHLIAPAVALVIAGILLGGQGQKISRLEDESNLLRKYIATEKSRIESRELKAPPLRPGRFELVGEKFDWMELTEFLTEIDGDGGDRRKMISIKRKLYAMDQEELLAGLDQLQTLDPDNEGRKDLEFTILGILAEKVPEVVLARLSNALGNERNGKSWQHLYKALKSLAKKDPAAATEWFDAQIAAGAFDRISLDGKNSTHLGYEAQLFSGLLSSDPEAAGARIASLPADQRFDVLLGLRKFKEEDRVAHAAIVREYLSEREGNMLLSGVASTIAGTGNFEAVNKYLDDISATREERVYAAERVASDTLNRSSFSSEITDEKIDSMREWLGGHASDSVERVTGRTLAELSGGDRMNFSEAATMVLKYHDQSGSDELLTSFVNNTYHRGDSEVLRKLAEKISDPEKREEALGNLK